ncbi:MAG TPA: hypothetical protein VM347_25940 [Nonomuraea sp.]|nr:hypothetical protein [Nonomuraea sp.]
MDLDDWLKLPDSGARMVVFPASEVAAVAEVVSPGPGNHRRDYEIKPVKYAAAGIPVFMRVELEGPRVEVLELGRAATR